MYFFQLFYNYIASKTRFEFSKNSGGGALVLILPIIRNFRLGKVGLFLWKFDFETRETSRNIVLWIGLYD